MTGLVGVSTNSSFVRGVNARSTAARSEVSTYEKRQPAALEHLVEEAERAAVGVVSGDDVVAGREAARDRVDGRHSGGEGERRAPSLDRGEVALERRPGGVLRARVLEPLVATELRLDVGGCLEQRRDDRPGRRIWLLAGVDAHGAESGGGLELHGQELIL